MEGADAAGKYIMQYNNGNPTWMQIESGAGFNETNRACILIRASTSKVVVRSSSNNLQKSTNRRSCS